MVTFLIPTMRFFRFHFFDGVHQQKGITVRKNFLDLVDVEEHDCLCPSNWLEFRVCCMMNFEYA